MSSPTAALIPGLVLLTAAGASAVPGRLERQEIIHANNRKAIAEAALKGSLDSALALVASPAKLAKAMENSPRVHASPSESRRILSGIHAEEVKRRYEKFRRSVFQAFEDLPEREIARLQQQVLHSAGGLDKAVQMAMKKNFEPKYLEARALALRLQLAGFARDQGPTDEEICGLMAGTLAAGQIDQALAGRCRLENYFEENRDSISRWVRQAVAATVHDYQEQEDFLGSLRPGRGLSMGQIRKELEAALAERARGGGASRGLFSCLGKRLDEFARQMEAARFREFVELKFPALVDSAVGEGDISRSIAADLRRFQSKPTCDSVLAGGFQRTVDSLLLARYLGMSDAEDAGFAGRIAAEYAGNPRGMVKGYLESVVQERSGKVRRHLAAVRFAQGYRDLDSLVLGEREIAQFERKSDAALTELASKAAQDTVRRRDREYLPELVAAVESSLISTYALSVKALRRQMNLADISRDAVLGTPEFATARDRGDKEGMSAVYLYRVQGDWASGPAHPEHRRYPRIFRVVEEHIQALILLDLRPAEAPPSRPRIAASKAGSEGATEGSVGGNGPNRGPGGGGSGGMGSGSASGGGAGGGDCPEIKLLARRKASVGDLAASGKPMETPEYLEFEKPVKPQASAREMISFLAGAVAGGLTIGLIYTSH